MHMWGITKMGKKISGNIVSPAGPVTEVLNHLHENKTATTDEISSGTGLTKKEARRVLRKLRTKGMVRDLSTSE